MTTEIKSTRKIVQGKQSTDNYPYGRLKCTMTFEVEYKENKGYRGVTQSINPKTGRLNAPKKGTYNNFMFMTEDENGHFHFHALHINGFEDVEKFITFLSNNPEIKFSAPQNDDLYAKICATIKLSAMYTKLAKPEMKDDFLEAIKFREFIKLFKNKANIYEAVNVGFKAEPIKAFEHPTESAFTFTIREY